LRPKISAFTESEPMTEPIQPWAAPPPETNEPLPGAVSTPTPERAPASFRTRLAGPSPWLIGLVAGALVVIGASAVIVAASGSSPAIGPAAGAANGAPSLDSANGGPSVDTGWQAPAGAGALGGGRAFAMGRGMMGLPGGRDITIKAISGSSLSLETTDGWTRTITVTSATKITRGGQTISVSDLKVGDTIVFSQTKQSDGSYTIDAIQVVVPTVGGTVDQVTGSGFTLKDRSGVTWTITVNGSTAYTLGQSGASGSKSDVKAGSNVVVQGTQGSGNTITAISVRISVPQVSGKVTAKDSSSITIERAGSTTVTVKVTSSTTYQVQGVTNAGLKDVTVGMHVTAEGPQASDGTITATAVRAGNVGAGGGHGWGRGGFPSFGGGFGPWGGKNPTASPDASPSAGGNG
jgi:hypothetical protein